jgi:hypothetical protein
MVLCRAQYVTQDKEKGLTAVRGETVSHTLCRAPLRTHENSSILCRALGRVAHDKDWLRRQVDQGFVVHHMAGRTTKNGPSAWRTRPFAVRHVAGRTAKNGPGTRWTRPVVVRLVAWRTKRMVDLRRAVEVGRSRWAAGAGGRASPVQGQAGFAGGAAGGGRTSPESR